MKKPTKPNWGVIDKDDWDAAWAYEQFAGKSFDAAEQMFRDHACHYLEALGSMPPVAFNFYSRVYINYILSDHAKSECDGASSFLHLLIHLLTNFRSLATLEALILLLNAAEIVSKNQIFYDADTDIYGEFSELHRKIIKLAAQVAQS